MPNWCYNSATISGPKEDLDKFVQAISSPIDEEVRDDYDLTLPYPTPQELKDTKAGFYFPEPHENWKRMLADGEVTQEWYDELVRNNAEGYAKDQANVAKYGYKNWYDWNIAHWGTKWAPRVEHFDYNNDHYDGDWRVELRYETAWAPPSGLILELSRQFPTLTFHTTFDEESQAYVGCEIFENGHMFDGYLEPGSASVPSELNERYEAIQEKFRNGDPDDDAFQDLLDWQCDAKDVTEDLALTKYNDWASSLSR